MRREIPLGLLYSVTGTYGAIGRDALDGARLALEEINGAASEGREMTRFRTPNFRGRQAIILHRSSNDTGQLARQLKRLGTTVEVCWPELPAESHNADVIFLDADNGFNGLLPWPPSEAPLPSNRQTPTGFPYNTRRSLKNRQARPHFR